MRIAVAVAFAAVLVLPRAAAAQTSLDGFGSLSMNNLTSLGNSGMPVDFGGRVSFDVVPGVQAIGEFGRIGNVLPSTVALPLSFAPVDLRVSAFYGEGGIRLLAAPRSASVPTWKERLAWPISDSGSTGSGRCPMPSLAPR